MKRLHLLIIVLWLHIASLMAIPAHPGTAQVLQPDGTSVTLRLCGDEWQHYTTTADGYTVVQDQQGYYVYAALQDGLLVPTTQVARDADQRTAAEQAWLAGTQKHLAALIPDDMLQLRQQLAQQQQQTLAHRRAGTYDYSKFKGLIILVEYNDRKFFRDDYKTIINDMVNKEGYTGYDNEVYTGSVYDYFYDNSGGKFKPHFDVAGPYTINYSQYAANGHKDAAQLIQAAINAADADVDYSLYDGDGNNKVDLVFLIFAGHGANYVKNDQRLLWPHRSTTSGTKDGIQLRDYVCTTELYGVEGAFDPPKLDGIGTICHEFSHVLGLPDFYDTDYEKGGGQSHHPGRWSVMSEGCYLNRDRTPAGYSLYERYSVGFIDEPEVISQAGSYTLAPLPLSLTGYRINSAVDNEFFLFENRQKDAFRWDAYLPGSGMLVHHVDKTNPIVWTILSNTVNTDPAHNYYKIVRAGGEKRETSQDGKETIYLHTASDVFPGSDNITELTNSTPTSNLLSHAGLETPWVLKNIQQTTDDLVTFDVESASQTQGIIELHTTGTTPGTPLYNLHGQRVTPQHRGILIQQGHKILSKGRF